MAKLISKGFCEEIIVDSREQLPLWSSAKVKKLDVGDYSISGYEERFAIERKSGADFCQTLTKGHERFKKELERARNYDFFAIVVEEPYSNIVKNQWIGSIYSKVKGAQVVAIANTLRVKYNIHIIFCSSRVAAKTEIKGLMSSYLRVKHAENKKINVAIN